MCVVMQPKTLRTCRRLAISGVFAWPSIWLLRKLLSVMHLLREPVPGTARETVGDYMLDATWWDAAVILSIAVTFCSAILLYVIVCPPPRDIDQHVT